MDHGSHRQMAAPPRQPLAGQPPSGLTDRDYARFAWARFRSLLAWMTLAAATIAAAAIVLLAYLYGPLHLVTMFAILGGVGGSVMLAGALMGLAFLSSGSGHDEDVERID